MIRRAVIGAALVVSVSILTACGDDEGEPTVEDPTPLSSAAPSGERVCDFVPRASVEQALGTDSFEVDGGHVSRDSAGALSGAGCRVSVDGTGVLAIRVDFMLGYAGNGFRDGLQDDRYNQLPADAGLGYSWTDKADDGRATAEARLSRGDYLIETQVVGIAEGRDPEADAVALAQQAGETLEIPDAWALPGTPPSR